MTRLRIWWLRFWYPDGKYRQARIRALVDQAEADE